MSKSQYIIKNVSKFYELDNGKHTVLKNISLNLDTQDITVILGESGCGKTTLLRIIANLEDASEGGIQYIKDGSQHVPRVGVVFQESRLMPWLNVSENIAFYEKKHDSVFKRFKKILHLENFKDDYADVDKYLEMMKLTKFRNLYPHELSGGMAQRVSIARALYSDPDILLMDEPFSALDYFTRMDMQNEIIKIHKTTNKGIIFVTHDIDEAIKIAGKIIIFTKNYEMKEFKIKQCSDKDYTDDYLINLKKEILNSLHHAPHGI